MKRQFNNLILAAVISLILVSFSYAETISISVPECKAEFKTEKDGQRIIAEGYAVSGSQGAPMLPYKEFSIILPPQVDEKDLLKNKDTAVKLGGITSDVLKGQYKIAPTPAQIIFRKGKIYYLLADGKEVFSVASDKLRDATIYSKNAFYPDKNVSLVEIGNMRKWRIARVRYYPYRYNPVTGQLVKVNSGSISLEYKLTAALKDKSITVPVMSDTALDDQVKSISVNYPQASPSYKVSQLNKSGPAFIASQEAPTGYMIITTNEIYNKSQGLINFINHKKSLGFNVLVATEDQWDNLKEAKTFSSRADKIRDYLKNNYLAQNILYVLLVGRPAPRDNIHNVCNPGMFNTASAFNQGFNSQEALDVVPMKIMIHDSLYDSTFTVPSDWYYSSLTDNSANYYDVIAGRIPFYGNYSDLNAIFDRIIGYESGNFNGVWQDNVLLSMCGFGWGDTSGYLLGDSIKTDVIDRAGLHTIGNYKDGFEEGLDGAAFSTEDTIKIWNRGAGIHILRGHGDPNHILQGWTGAITCGGSNMKMLFGLGDIPYLDNRYPSFTLQDSCYTGSPCWEDNLGYQLLKQGAIATISASELMPLPFGCIDINCATGGAFAYYYVNGLIVDNLSCGAAFSRMKAVTNSSTFCGLVNKLEFNLYGDPSLKYIHSEHELTTSKFAVSINNGAAYANFPNVVLSFNTEQNYSQVSISNDGKNWSQFELYHNFKEWRLPDGVGQKNVYVRFRNPIGLQSPIVSDSIEMCVDSLMPTVTISGVSSGWNKSLTITLIAQDSPGGGGIDKVYYSFDNFVTINEYAGPVNFSQNGITLFKFFCRNNTGIYSDIGNKEIKINTIIPEIFLINSRFSSYMSQAYIYYKLNNIPYSLKHFIRYKVDNGNFSSYMDIGNTDQEQYIAIPLGPPDGIKKIYVQIKDEAENSSDEKIIEIKRDATPPQGAIKINGGALTTTSNMVKLNFTISDAAPSDNCTMHFWDDDRNIDNGYRFQPEIDYLLSDGGGEKKIYACFMDSNNNLSPTYSAVITLLGPLITGITPNPQDIGEIVTITGTGFGHYSGKVELKTTDGAVLAMPLVSSGWSTGWSDTKIVCRVPEFAQSGNIVVTNREGIKSRLVSFIVKTPTPSAPAWLRLVANNGRRNDILFEWTLKDGDYCYVEESSSQNGPWKSMFGLPRNTASYVVNSVSSGVHYYRLRAGKVKSNGIAIFSLPSNVMVYEVPVIPTRFITGNVYTYQWKWVTRKWRGWLEWGWWEQVYVPIPGAQAYIKGTNYIAFTDSKGNFSIAAPLDPGTYSVTCYPLNNKYCPQTKQYKVVDTSKQLWDYFWLNEKYPWTKCNY
ncbi:MAG: C25 family cysteine peptidase [Candidatus Omnitrophota bacterium]